MTITRTARRPRRAPRRGRPARPPASPGRRRCGARASGRPRRQSSAEHRPVVVRGDRCQAPGADRRDARRSASIRRRVSASSARATRSSSPARTCSASAPWAASGNITSGSRRRPISLREPEPVEPAGGEHDRIEPALSKLAQARVDVAAQRLDRERRFEREELRATARGRGADPHARPDLAGADNASRGSSRSRYAPTTRPSVSVDVMSFAECTATSMRPASSASSISLTKTPRAPIWPNGCLRSRSPAVVIGTNASSTPGPPQQRRRPARPA